MARPGPNQSKVLAGSMITAANHSFFASFVSFAVQLSVSPLIRNPRLKVSPSAYSAWSVVEFFRLCAAVPPWLISALPIILHSVPGCAGYSTPPGPRSTRRKPPPPLPATTGLREGRGQYPLPGRHKPPRRRDIWGAAPGSPPGRTTRQCRPNGAIATRADDHPCNRDRASPSPFAAMSIHTPTPAQWQHALALALVPLFRPCDSYSSCRRHHMPVSLRPLGARSSHWYMPQMPSSPRA